MIMDLQDKSATLEYQVAQSNIPLFGTSSKVFTAGDPQDNEEDTIPVTMMTVSVPRITTTLKMTLMTMTLKTVRKRKVLLQIGQIGLGGTLVFPIIPQSSLHNHERMHRHSNMQKTTLI